MSRMTIPYIQGGSYESYDIEASKDDQDFEDLSHLTEIAIITSLMG